MRTLAVLFFAVLSIVCLSRGQTNRIDFRFDFIRNHVELSEGAESPLPATIRFVVPPAEALLQKLEKLGVRFEYHRGSRLGTATVYPARVTLSLLPFLEEVEEILTVQPSWRPVRVPPLDVSRPQVQADTAWLYHDQRGRNITGKGILIADFDTGVDFFHPMLWFADGDTVDWLDVNGNTIFDAGTDAVDLNSNGVSDPGEVLNYVEIPYSANTLAIYDSNIDFLYNDANGNGARDFGVSSGFTESSPTYGEQWFISLDVNHNNRLNVGEMLIGLKTSKIRAIREIDSTIHRRGVDLINANPDTGPYGGHGTSVAGIAVGGIASVHRLAGIAPGAEMIFGSISYNSSPRFFTGLPGMMAWALAESADVMLCEDGEWVWEYLDGSSNEEVMINEMAAAGIAQVMPAGNLTGGGMQKTMTVNGNDSTTATFTGGQSSSVWPSVRWRGGLADVVVRLQVGTSEFIVLPGDGSSITIGGKSVYSNKSISSRGTVMMAIYVASSGFTTYNVRAINTTASQLRIEGMLGDDGFSWSGLARWSAPSENNTVTWPATADSAIGVGAYKNKASDTNINSFSGRGTRIDGTWPVDVAAPGSTVYSIGRNVTYVPFGGTSSAGPHVAGAAALILQADTALRHKEVQELLRTGAIADGFTGTVPNTTWGYGKLRIVNSLLPVITSVYDDQSPSAWKLLQNYPNPFNPKTKIVYEVPGSGSREFVELRVFDVLGREVTTLVNGERSVGSYSVEFDASNLASGVYFYRLRGSGFSITRKLMVLR